MIKADGRRHLPLYRSGEIPLRGRENVEVVSARTAGVTEGETHQGDVAQSVERDAGSVEVVGS